MKKLFEPCEFFEPAKVVLEISLAESYTAPIPNTFTSERQSTDNWSIS